MALKGYPLDEKNHQDRLLNEFHNDYGMSLKDYEPDITALNSKPRNITSTTITNPKK